MNRRGFFGLLAAAFVFPWVGVRSLCGRPTGWRLLHERVGLFDCFARYRWIKGGAVSVEWVRYTMARTPELDGWFAGPGLFNKPPDFETPLLVLSNDPPRLRFMETVSHGRRRSAVLTTEVAA